MGTSLTGLTPATTYDALIKVGDNGPLSATAKVLSDGLGNDSPLAMSTTNVGIGTTSPSNTFFVGIPNATTGKGISLGTTGGIEFARFGIINPTVNNNSFIGSISNNDFAIYSNNTERVTITSGGNVGIGTTSPPSKLTVDGVIRLFDGTLTGSGGVELSSQAGFGFAAQSNSYKFRNAINTATYAILDSEGLKFNGDTAAANALDDYEEGTWTATLTDGTRTKSATAIYTKIGRVVYIQGGISNVEDPNSFTGDVYITGVPFTPLSGVSLYGFNNYLSTASIFTPYLESNQVIRFYRVGAATADNTQMQGSDLEFYSDIYFAGQFTV